MKWEGMGIRVNGKWITNLRFADDITLIGKSVEELNLMLIELMKEYRKVGLEINASKTKLMSKEEGIKSIWVNQTEIENVGKYKYLGQIITFGNKMDEEIEQRITNAWKAFWSLKSVFKSKMNLDNKIKMLNSVVIPVLAYSAQTWALTSKQKKKLEVTQYRMLRSILGIKLKDRVSKVKMKERLNAIEIGYLIKKLKFKYVGHMASGM